MLYDIWMEPLDKGLFKSRETRRTAYCNAIKKIGIELESGMRIDISPELLECMEKDLVNKEN